MSEAEIRRGRLRGMGPPAAVAPLNPPPPQQADSEAPPEPVRAPSALEQQGEGPRPRERGHKGARNPYAGERKIQVNPRVFPTLWARYEQLVADVRQAGGRATVTDLVNAVLHFRGPETSEEAQALLNRFRTLLAQDPPAGS